jgi:hypothetical protein
MDVLKTLRTLIVFSGAISCNVYSATCQELLNKLPPPSGDTQVFSETISKYEDDCKQRPSSNTPEALNECIKAGMRAMGAIGNYVAQIRMAKIECKDGNDEISKTWLGMIVNNNNASEAEKDIGREAIADNPSLKQNQ